MRTVSSFHTRRQAGFSLLEILGVIGVIGILFAVYMANQDNADKGVDSIAITSEIQSVHAGLKNAFRNHYADITTPKFVESQDAPPAMVRGAGATATLEHAGKGTVVVASADCNGGTDNCFSSTWSAIKTGNCLSTINKVATQMDGITVGATSVKAVGGTFDRDAASTACAAAATLTLTFTDA